MPFVDDAFAHLATGWVFVVFVGALLGLRHATDPDHLTTILAMRLYPERCSPARIGAAWGAGHATTMVSLGLLIILVTGEFPKTVQNGLEVAVGVLIALLGFRSILVAVRFGAKLLPHSHPHAHHVGESHTHPHFHLTGEHSHNGRTSTTAYFAGLLHGAGGSTGIVSLILVGQVSQWQACASLLVIGLFSALSMVACSLLVSRGLGASLSFVSPRNVSVIGGCFAMLFGLYYALASFNVVPYFG